jgi:RimJ/RimL family protein N-acetyltransferase
MTDGGPAPPPVAKPDDVREERLRDGSTVWVRPIRPSDKDELREGYEALSDESRYRRFLAAPGHLSEERLAYLTEVDHHDHEALVALEPQTGRGIGVARFVRSRQRPDAAEVAVTIADDWQGRGAGTLLLELLSDRAREEGVERFTGDVLAGNRDVLDVVERLGGEEHATGAGSVEVDVPLPPAGTGDLLAGLMRLAATGALLDGPADED